jgi:acetyl esterase/lipase
MEDQCTKPRSFVGRPGKGAFLAISLLLLLVPRTVLGADPVTVQYDRIDGVAPELLSLDIHCPEAAGPLPVIVYVHGGGWCFGDKGRVAHMASFFAGRGYILVSVNYRLSPDIRKRQVAAGVEDHVRYPTHPRDVAKAFAWVHNNIARHGGNPERIGLIGHSAGGHLALLLGTDASFLAAEGLGLGDIRALCDLDAGSIDIPERYSTIKREHPFFARCIVNAFGEDPKIWAKASPIHNVSPGKRIPPMLLAHQMKHTGRAKDHQAMRDVLLESGYVAETFPIEGLTHGEIQRLLGAPSAAVRPEKRARVEELSERVAAFFDQHLKTDSSDLHPDQR